MKRAAFYLIAIVGALIMLIPLAWTVSTALKTRQAVDEVPPRWIPVSPHLTSPDGSSRQVTVVAEIAAPAAVVKVIATGATVVVPADRLATVGDSTTARLSTSDIRSPVVVVSDHPAGVAHVRYNDGSRIVNEFVDPARVRRQFDPQWTNFYPADPSDPQQRLNSAWTALPMEFHKFVLNTWAVTAINIVLQTFSCSLVAYGFARFKFRGNKFLFLLLLSTMMLPSQVTMIPVFLMWNTVGLIDTFGPLTIPAAFAQNAFFIFLLRQFYMGIPRDLDEAAMIDGCGPFRIWWTVILPLSRPALTTVAVLSFIGHWDDFMGPLIYLNSVENFTVAIALRMFQDLNGSDFQLLMAAALIHIIPVLLVFLFAQRYFVKGIAMTGLKA